MMKTNWTSLGLMMTMMSKSDRTIVEKVLSLEGQKLDDFMNSLDSGAKGYLEEILKQYERGLNV